MSIDEMHDSIRSLLNIGQGQYYSPEDIDLQINTAINDLFRMEFDHFEATQKITDKLGYFKTQKLENLDESNQASIPSDFYHMAMPSVEVTFENSIRPGKLLKTSQYTKRKASSAFAPTEDYPIASMLGSKVIEVLPVSALKVRMFYLRKPAKVKYGYNIAPSGTGFVYNEIDSTQIDWPEIDHPRIQTKALTLLGVSLRDSALANQERIIIQNNQGA